MMSHGQQQEKRRAFRPAAMYVKFWAPSRKLIRAGSVLSCSLTLLKGNTRGFTSSSINPRKNAILKQNTGESIGSIWMKAVFHTLKELLQASKNPIMVIASPGIWKGTRRL